ncbi:MAG: transporter substrate-binding domain-containing protein [Thermodesulfobacteriota bacterium]
MKKVIAVCIMAACVSLFFIQVTIAGGIMEKIVAEKKLRVGVAPWKNMIMWDEKTNRYEGIIADDLRNFEEITGIKAEITNTNWAGMIAGLQTGKWDAIMNGLGASVQRSMAVAFTEPYGYYCEASLVRKNDTVKSFADLDQPGNSISITAGTSAFELWKGKFKNAKIITYTEQSAGILDVIQGRSKAFMSDLLINSFRAKEIPELKLFIPENTIWFYEAHAVRYADLDLLVFLDTYIRNMKVRGWYQELGAKWGMPPEWSTGKASK